MRRRGAPTSSSLEVPSVPEAPPHVLSSVTAHNDILGTFAARATSALESDDTHRSLLDISPADGYLDRRKKCLVDLQASVLRSTLSDHCDDASFGPIEAQEALVAAVSGPDGALKQALEEMDGALRRAYIRSIFVSSETLTWESNEKVIFLDRVHDFLDLCLSAAVNLADMIASELVTAVDKYRSYHVLAVGSEERGDKIPPNAEEAMSLILHHRMARAIGAIPGKFLPEFLKLAAGLTTTKVPEEQRSLLSVELDEEERHNLWKKMKSLSERLRTILSKCTEATSVLDDGTSRVVSVVHREVDNSDQAPTVPTMEHRGEDEIRSNLAVAAAAQKMEKHILSSLLAMSEEERIAELSVAEEVHKQFLKTMADPNLSSAERVSILRGMDGSVQGRLLMHKVWISHKKRDGISKG
mmetsp:Transcript_33465/g.77182  ORF Transcript_33465/g.77182 Transcript_33465/m.77182 type:complete len:413 (-) Transcript_33465:260-1498(-)